MKRLLLVAMVVGFASPTMAQTVTADRFRLNIGPCVVSSGKGSPLGVVSGNICDTYIDTTTSAIWSKWSGTGTTTGWNVGFNASAGINGDLVVTADTDITGYVGSPGYVSQLTGWRITGAGAGDFRYLYTDELHAKLFIADLEQALAGGQIICKSVTLLGSNFTNPAGAATATLTVRDLPSAENVSVFQSGDWIGLRTFSRTAGSLTIAETFGTVSAYADQAGGVQTWTFLRGTGANGGSMATSTVVATDAIAIDYGVSGNGCHEVDALDGLNSVNSPYSQTWTWTTSPIPANRVLRTRVGNLRGITSVAGEYGLIAGDGNLTATGQYIRVSNTAGVEVINADIAMYSGGVQTVLLEHTTPTFSLGNPRPTTYGAVSGIWMGNDAGTYKFRVGNPAGNRMTWDGTTLSVVGEGSGITNINGGNIQTGTISAAKLTVGTGLNLIRNSECRTSTEDWSTFTNSGQTISLNFSLAGWTLGNLSNTCFFTVAGLTSAGEASQAYTSDVHLYPIVPGNRYEASVYLGVHRSGNTVVQLVWHNSAGAQLSAATGNTCTAAFAGGVTIASFCRSGVVATAPVGAVYAGLFITTTHTAEADPYVFWVRAYMGEALANQTELTPWGGSGVTEITGGLIKTGTVTANHIASNTITATNIAAGTITATQISTGTITADKMNIATLSALSANLGTITAGSITGVTASFGGTVDLNSSGVQVAPGHGAPYGYKFESGSIGTFYDTSVNVLYFKASAGMNWERSGAAMAWTALGLFSNDANNDLGTSGNQWRDLYISGTVLLRNISVAAGGSTEYPVVWSPSSERIYRKLNGYTGTCTAPASIVVERGIVVACS